MNLRIGLNNLKTNKMKIEKLTVEQEALMPVIRDRWIAQLFDLKEINMPQLIKGINWLYTFSKLEEPKIIVCDSIIEAQITIHTLKHGKGADLSTLVVEPLCSYGDINDYGWVAFHEYFTKIGVNNSENFNQFASLVKSNYYSMIQMEKVCVVIRNPEHILLDVEKRMNSVTDYAIKFKDGTGMNFVNGFYLSDELFNRLKNKEYVFDDFSKETNEEVKSACIAFMQQAFGDLYLFDFLSQSLKEIDTFVDKKENTYLIGTTNSEKIGVYTLYKGSVNNTEVAYIRCYCPSTDRMFFLGVNPENNNAKDGIASLYRVPKKLSNNIKYIQRQGERFSTVFDKVGTDNLKSGVLTVADIQDTVTITGVEYFNKMRYEY
jgi:hypothetical protein